VCEGSIGVFDGRSDCFMSDSPFANATLGATPVLPLDDDEEDEDDDPPDARRADHVEGTSRPSGETQPIPVTTTLRRGGTRDWAGMLVSD